jgi:tetratricopeptide (TPR) repeat protein
MALTAFLLWDLVNYTVAAVGTLAATLAGWVAGIALQPTAAGATKAQVSRPQPVSTGAVALSSILFLIAFMIAILRPVLGQYAQRVALSQPVGSRSQVEAIQRAAQLAPWEARYQNHLAGAYLAIESGEQDAQRRLAVLNLARAASEKAIATDARYAPFYARYGWVLARLIVSGAPDVRVEQVRTVLATAIHRDPANRDILDGNTETWLMLNRHKEARIDALRSSELYPELAKPMGYIGLIALREKRWLDAADTLNIAVARDWRGDLKLKAMVLTNLSAAYIELGRFKEAESAAIEALGNDPELEAARQNRAFAAKQLGAQASSPQ